MLSRAVDRGVHVPPTLRKACNNLPRGPRGLTLNAPLLLPDARGRCRPKRLCWSAPTGRWLEAILRPGPDAEASASATEPEVAIQADLTARPAQRAPSGTLQRTTSLYALFLLRGGNPRLTETEPGLRPLGW